MAVVDLPRELLDFYESLEMLMKESAGKVELPKMEITEADLAEHYKMGVPLFLLSTPEFSPQLGQEVFEGVCKLLEEKRPPMTSQVKVLRDAAGQTINVLMDDFIRGEDKNINAIVKEHKVSKMTAEFIFEYTAKPFMQAYAKLVGSLTKDEKWQKNCCPVCGNKARYARINQEDNKRYLQCSLCDHQWLFKRLACPNCANEDHNSLRTLLIEETPAYQIHVCEQCKTYLKVFDSRQNDRDQTSIKDATTVFLDIIAQQKGYISSYFTS